MTLPKPVRLTDDYDDCQHCGRTGLLHTIILDDGSHVGSGCMKKVCGYAVPLKQMDWQPKFEVIAEHREYGHTYLLWRLPAGIQTRTTRDGSLIAVGGQAQVWHERGWTAVL